MNAGAGIRDAVERHIDGVLHFPDTVELLGSITQREGVALSLAAAATTEVLLHEVAHNMAGGSGHDPTASHDAAQQLLGSLHARGREQRARRIRLAAVAAASIAAVAVLAFSLAILLQGVPEPTTAETFPPPPDWVAAAPRSARVDRVEGDVRVVRADALESVIAEAGFPIRSGDRFQTRRGRALLSLPGGAAAYLQRFTTVVFSTDGRAIDVSLASGTVYIETAREEVGLSIETAKEGAGLSVETPHCTVVELGTRFSTEVSAVKGTTVVVVEGAVEVSNERGTAGLRAGDEIVVVSRASPPGDVRPATDLRRKLGWATTLGARLLPENGSIP